MQKNSLEMSEFMKKRPLKPVMKKTIYSMKIAEMILYIVINSIIFKILEQSNHIN
jgi:hypothetical protein